MKKMNKKSGFTLVEIMIVVAIIGLLAAIGIPSFQRARANSVEKAKANNVRIINAAVEEYAMDNAITDGGTVASDDWLTYIKGGTNQLSVGINDPTITDATVGTDFTVGDVYP